MEWWSGLHRSEPDWRWNARSEPDWRCVRSSTSPAHPKIARNNVHEPLQIGRQLAGVFRGIERHDQQIRLHRLHKIGRGKAGVAANAAHFDRHIGMTEIENEMLQFCILIRFWRGAVLFRARFIEGGDKPHHINAFRIFARRQMQRPAQAVGTVFRIFHEENDLAQWLWLTRRMGKENDRAAAFPQKPASDVSQEGMKDYLFLERTRHDQVDIVTLDRSQNCSGWIPLLVMDRGILRQ